MNPTPADALRLIRSRIAAAERRAGQPVDTVTLVAVSKGIDAAGIRALADAGQRRFGESYLSEALPKLNALADLGLEWHYIGPLQSNKTRLIAARFAWVHGIDRLMVAQRLSDQRPAGLPPLDVCIQINISGETSKSGVDPAAAPELVRSASRLPRLRVRGLMAIPAPDPNLDARRRAFRGLRELQERLCDEGYPLDTLSIGMSDDFEAAIAEGATMVRIGTALFGPRA